MARKYHMRRVALYKKLADSSWATTAIVLSDATEIEVKLGIGKVKDTFKFRISNANDRLTKQLFSGNASATEFTLPSYFTPPSTFLNTDKVKVYVGGVLQAYTINYTISGATITFTSPPAAGSDNIEVLFEVITADDKVSIWIWQDAEWDDMTDAQKEAAFAIEGTITQPSLTSNDSNRLITVDGIGIIEALFASLAFAKPASAQPWITTIQEMIAQINQYAPAGKKIYGESATEWEDLGNPNTKHNGDSFPDVQYSSAYKRGIEILEELTQDKYTGDGQYIYYVKRYSNGNYGLYVRYKNPIVQSGNVVTQGVEPIETKAKRSTDEVINAVIYNCGFDPYERGMEYLNYNPASQSSIGSKWKYITTTAHLGQALLNIEFEADTSKWETTDDGTRKENFPKDASYPYTFQFEGRNTNGSLTGVSATAADDDAFADAVRLEAKWRGKEETDRIITLYSNPRYSVTFLIYQSNNYILGEAYEIILPSFGLHNVHPLRLIESTHRFWTTELEFEEDETVAVLA